MGIWPIVVDRRLEGMSLLIILYSGLVSGFARQEIYNRERLANTCSANYAVYQYWREVDKCDVE